MNDRDYGAGKHDFPKVLRDCGIDPCLLHDGVCGIDDWVERVVEIAESGIAKRYTSNDLKGDAFEHLVQCVIEYLNYDEVMDCIEVQAMKRNEAGVDLIGETLDGKPHLHQCKFTKNPKFQMPYKGFVAEFVAACPKFDAGSGYRMTLWTTGGGIRKIAQDTVGSSLRVFDIDWLGDTLGSEERFWDDVYGRSLDATPKPKVGRISEKHQDPVRPHDYQQAALDTFIAKVATEKTFKGRYIYPTGAGKTLIESLILNHQIDRCNGGAHLVVAPRIALLIQLMSEYREFIGDRYFPIGLHSGNEEPESDETDWMRRTQKNTTDPSVVKREIDHAISMNRSAVVFSTYHSLHKLTPKFGDFCFDTMIADESQYCVSENYFEQIQDIDAKIKLYFTATERHYIKKDGSKVERSNDNERVFGKSLGSETVRNLVKRGILVEPILHLMRGAPKSDEVNHDTLVAEAQHIANEQRKLVSGGLRAKTLFACREAANVEIIVDLKNNMENLKKLQREVPEHTIFTIISKKPFGAMIDGVPVNRKSFLDQLKDCDGDSLIFHYNILSEGIDVDGITGVAILRKMGDAKLMQTIGRCLRPYKNDPSLKPHAYVSVPIIEDDIRKSEHLNEIVRKILESGLDIDAEKIVISDKRKKEVRGTTANGGRKTPSHGGKESTQIEIDIFKHELRTIIKVNEEQMAEDYHLGMLNSEFTNDVIDDVLDGKYPFAEHGISSHSDARQLNTNLDSYLDEYFVFEKAWNRKRIFESQANEKGKPTRPITPLHMIETHVDRLGDITGRSVLTFNVEYIPYLKEKGTNVVLATRRFCEYTKNLAESQVIETEYLTVETVMSKGLKFDFVIGNPPYQELKPEHSKSRIIWDLFVEDAFKILKNGGKMALIHPAGWRNVAGDYRDILTLLQSMDMEWLSIHNLDDGRKNFDVGQRYDMYVATKRSTPGFSTDIVGEDRKEYSKCIKSVDYIPNFQSDLFSRVITQDEDDRVNFIYSRSRYGSDKKWVRPKKGGSYIHSCVYNISRKDGSFTYQYSNTTGNNLTYDDGKPHFGVPKVIFGVGQQTGIPMVDGGGVRNVSVRGSNCGRLRKSSTDRKSYGRLAFSRNDECRSVWNPDMESILYRDVS